MVEIVRQQPNVTTTWVTASGASNNYGSGITASILSYIDWISVKSINSGSTYSLSVKDADGYLMQSMLSHTGDWAYLSPIPASGIIVFTVSGAQCTGSYGVRIAYA